MVVLLVVVVGFSTGFIVSGMSTKELVGETKVGATVSVSPGTYFGLAGSFVSSF